VIPPGDNNTSEASAIPRLGKTLVYSGPVSTDNFNGTMTIEINATDILRLNDSAIVEYSYTLKISGTLDNGTYYNKTDSSTGVFENMIVIAGYIRDIGLTLDIVFAIVPQAAPNVLSQYRSANSSIATYVLSETSRDDKPAVEVTAIGLLSNYTFIYSIPYAFVAKYDYKDIFGEYHLEIQDYSDIEPLAGGEVQKPLESASREGAIRILQSGQSLMNISGEMTINVEKAYKYGDTYRFFASSEGYVNVSSSFFSFLTNYTGLGVFGYSSKVPYSAVGPLALIINPANVSYSINLAMQSYFNVEGFKVYKASVSVSGNNYDGYIGEYTKNNSSFKVYILSTGITAHMIGKIVLEGGEVYDISIRMTSVSGVSAGGSEEESTGRLSTTSIVAISAIAIIVLIALLARRLKKKRVFISLG